MLLFRYDKTFEGLLCALFDAYAGRAFPDALAGPDEPGPMFTERVHQVVTQREKSDRVWRGLERKLPREVRNMLMHVWMSEEAGSDLLLLRYMRRVFDSPQGIATDFTDGDVLEARKIAQKVGKEALYIIQFVRFCKAGDGTYFAPVSPRHNALPFALAHFSDRFADQRWMIYDIRRRYGYYYDLETVSEVTLLDDANFPDGKLDERLMAEDEKRFQELWRGYFKSMAIRERINPKLHRQHMPRRFWKYLTEKG